MKCRHCSSQDLSKFLNLGFAPPSNAYLNKAGLQKAELYYPLRVNVCEQCLLVQTEDYAEDQFFSPDYAYFRVSSSWLEYAKNYSEKIIKSLKLDKNSLLSRWRRTMVIF